MERDMRSDNHARFDWTYVPLAAMLALTVSVISILLFTRHDLERKARQAETAAHIDEWLKSPGLQPPK
jgi:hypothetical protein